VVLLERGHATLPAGHCEGELQQHHGSEQPPGRGGARQAVDPASDPLSLEIQREADPEVEAEPREVEARVERVDEH
jgi:hypothetical protein